MGLKKLSKKIMAYTLTTAMMTGFFAVSNINLTTAWANDVTEWPSSAVSAGGDTYTGENVIISDSNGNLTTAIASNTLTLGAGVTVTIPSGKTLTLASGKTIVGGTSGCAISGGAVLSNSGITGGTITGSGIISGLALNGGTITGATLANVTIGGNGVTTTLKDCKAKDEASNAITVAEGGSAGQTNVAKIIGTFETGTNNVTKLSQTSGSGDGKFDFNNATVSGKILGDTSNTPLITGSMKAKGIQLSGKVASTSSDECLITLQDENSSVDCHSDGSGANGLANLTFGVANNFTDKFDIEYTVNDDTTEVSLFNVANADKFAKLMTDGKIKATNTDTDHREATGRYAFIKSNVLVSNVLPFEFDKSGRKVTATCRAKGCKYDGKSFDLNVRENVSYAVRTQNTVGVGMVLTASAESVKDNDKNLWTAFLTKNYREAFSASSYSGTGSAKFGLSGTEQATCTYNFVKKDISNAVINGLAANGITSFTSTSADHNYNAKVAKNLPDGFVSIELTANGTGITKTNDGGNSESSAFYGAMSQVGRTTTFSEEPTVTVVYKTEEGALAVLDMQAITGANSAVTLPDATGTGTQSYTLTGAGDKFTGSTVIKYKKVDQSVDLGAYTGSAIEVTGINGSNLEYSTDGTNFSDEAPSFTDAGDYEVYYRTSGNSDVHIALCTITPATVTATWSTPASYSYDGTAKTRKIVSVSGGNLSQANLDKFDTSSVKYAYTKASKSVESCVNQGEYTITATLTNSNKNYQLSSNITTMTINASEAVVTAKNATAYYDGKPHSIDKVTINAPEGSYKVLYGTTAGDCDSTIIPSFTEEGTYKVYYKIVEPTTAYEGEDAGNVTFADVTALTNGRSYVTLTVKPALTVKRSDSTAKTVTYTGKYFPITADAYCGTEKESDIKVNIYASKNSGDYTKVTNGIKDVGTYRFAYTLVIDGKEGSKVLMDDTVTIKAAAKKNLKNATASAKAVTYNANKQTAKVTVKYGKTTLKLNKDYTLKNATHINAGSFKVTITGKGNYTGTKTVTFKIAKRKVTKGVVTVKRNKKTFTVYVKIGKKNYKVAKTNYKLTSKYNKKTKKYAVTVAFKANYSGTVKKTVK